MKKKEDKNLRFEHDSDKEKIVFVPAEDIQVIHRVLDNWETVKQGWKKIIVSK